MERLNATERRTATGNWLVGYQSLRVACLSMPRSLVCAGMIVVLVVLPMMKVKVVKVEEDGGSDVLDGGGYPLIRERAGGRDQHRGLVNWVNINLLGLSAPTTLFTS